MVLLWLFEGKYKDPKTMTNMRIVLSWLFPLIPILLSISIEDSC